jgi:predicted outer membrane repeat protein
VKKLKKQAKATKMLMLMVLLGLFVVLTSVSSVSASTVYVNTTGDDKNGNGSAENPYQTIGKGIINVEENGTVQIANGKYSGTGNTNVTIDRSMTIAGQSQNKTIINGTGTNWIFHINHDVNVTITNLTLTNATASIGGAINNQGNLTVSNCTFTDNNANYFGGAIWNGCIISGVNGCTFTDNTASSGGGAIYNTGTISGVNGCTFTGNKAKGDGGAICNMGNLSINGTFLNNFATNGGAISNYGDLSVNNGNFTENFAINELGDEISGNGGAIYTEGILDINNCVFEGNFASFGGAISNLGNLTIRDSNFIYNAVSSANFKIVGETKLIYGVDEDDSDCLNI